MFIKHYLYDWCGYNTSLFHALYKSFEPFSAKALGLLSFAIGEYKLFPIHFIILLLFVSVKYKDIRTKPHIMKPLTTWVVSFLVGALCIHALKVYFHYQRPCSLLLLDFLYNDDCDGKSLPSGHTWYVTTFVYSMWSLMSRRVRAFAVVVAGIIAYSRIALGMHFPADVLYGAIVGGVVVSLMKPLALRWLKSHQDCHPRS
jgi:signal peptidase II